ERREIAQRCVQLPTLDDRSHDEILGYTNAGWLETALVIEARKGELVGRDLRDTFARPRSTPQRDVPRAGTHYAVTYTAPQVKRVRWRILNHLCRKSVRALSLGWCVKVLSLDSEAHSSCRFAGRPFLLSPFSSVSCALFQATLKPSAGRTRGSRSCVPST